MTMHPLRAARAITIIDAHEPQHREAFVSLCKQYAAGLPFSLCFQGFEAELAGLPGAYAPPSGCMLLALLDGQPVGCIAMRPLAPSGYLEGDARPACEMKRMFVQPAARGLGIGRMLALALLRRASSAGYRQMKLDTETTFVEATALYRALGFAEVPRYNDDPLEHTIWMSLALPHQQGNA
jgi:GNAT superfamily N-acetyltransferase